jgi:NADH:ubiquinone oxidoreductase subunit 6 (subunit J)
MLTSRSPWVRFECRPIELFTAAVVAVALFFSLTMVVTNTSWPVAPTDGVDGAPVSEFGKQLLTTYLVPFEVASVLLLVVMIGAAYLARQEKQ